MILEIFDIKRRMSCGHSALLCQVYLKHRLKLTQTN